MNRSTALGVAGGLLIGLLWFGATMRSRGDAANEMQLARAAKMPVLDGGRVKPLDTYARVQLMNMNRRQTYYDDKDDRQQAIKWMLNLMADGYSRLPAIVTLEDPDVQRWLGLRPRANGRFFVPEVIRGMQARRGDIERIMDPKQPQDKLAPIEVAVGNALKRAAEADNAHKEAEKVMEKQRTVLGAPEKEKVFRIENDQLLEMLGLEPRSGFRYSLDEFAGKAHAKTFQEFEKKAESAAARPEKDRDLVDVKVLELYGHLETHRGIVELRGPRMVPGATKDLEEWMPFGRSLVEVDPATNPAGAHVEKIINAYAQNDVKAFNKEVDAYLKAMEGRMPKEMSKVRLETWFNSAEPFYQCCLLYVVVLLLAIASWVVWQGPLRAAAFSLALLTCTVHTLSIGFRIYLTGRPPVTNLYSSAVFIGWGGVVVCLVVCALIYLFARKYRFANGIVLAAAAVLGSSTLVVAHHLGFSGDTMEVMQAVLDTNFWLATHVTTVTLGYTATFLAGFIAMLYVFFMLGSAVRSYYADRKSLDGGELVMFFLSVAGFVGVPAVAACGVVGAVWLLLAEGDPASVVLLGVLSMVVIVTAALVYGVVLAVNRFVPASFDSLRPGELPPVLAPLQYFSLTEMSSKILNSLVYGVICFALLLSFVGTVLGGIWADQSWGRFWGWDPKENGALLIVIINALILHARWSGLIRERGMCVLALLGNMITAWSWFGTNQLGVGLHAYGFNNTLALGCRYFWMSQFALAMFGLMPLRFWRAYSDKQPMTVAKPSIGDGPRLQSGRKGGTGIQPA